MLADLKDYYRRMGIAADDFHCPFFPNCSRFNPASFTTAKESFVSSGYENHTLPRILFLSLDSGSATNDPADKTLESVRRQEEIECQVLELPRNKHWYRTHELAYTLLRNFSPSLALEDAKHYFAHANSAKCCQNNPQRGQAAAVLFENCRVFIPGEIEILAPDVLITQGDYAKRAVEGAFPQTDIQPHLAGMAEIPEEVKLLSIDGNSVIWIHTYHPRNPNSKMNRDHYPLYEKIVFEFISQRPYVPFETASPAQPRITRQPRVQSRVPAGSTSGSKDLNYIFLSAPPQVPPDPFPTHTQCAGFEYMEMVQLCNLAEVRGMSRGRAVVAFGGDRGKYRVVSERMTRAAYVGNMLRKYVLVSAVGDFFKELGIPW